MPSKLKSETARANGARSRGPKSAATREISSRNSLRHGLTACSTILLAYESQVDFDEMVAEYTAIHQPATAEEESYVKEMIAARWRIQRLWTAETSVIDLEMIRQEPEIEKEFTHVNPGILLAVAIKSLIDNSRCLSLISRYESRLQRTHDRARKSLRDLQLLRKLEAAEPQAGPPEPTRPTPPPPAAPPSGVVAKPDLPVAPNAPPSQPDSPSPAVAILPRCNKVEKRTHRVPLARRSRRLAAAPGHNPFTLFAEKNKYAIIEPR